MIVNEWRYGQCRGQIYEIHIVELKVLKYLIENPDNWSKNNINKKIEI